MAETTIVATFAYRHEAEMAQGYLEDAGIPVVMMAGDAAGIELGFAAPYRASIAVRQEDAGAARDVLRETGYEENLA